MSSIIVKSMGLTIGVFFTGFILGSIFKKNTLDEPIKTDSQDKSDVSSDNNIEIDNFKK